VDDVDRFAAASGACFEKDAVGDFTGAAEELRVGEPVVASKAADGLAFIGDECERRVATHDIAEFLKLAVDGVLPEARPEGQGIEIAAYERSKGARFAGLVKARQKLTQDRPIELLELHA
jgi:hypothetical protein